MVWRLAPSVEGPNFNFGFRPSHPTNTYVLVFHFGLGCTKSQLKLPVPKKYLPSDQNTSDSGSLVPVAHVVCVARTF